MVTPSSGPGIIAPEKPIINALMKIPHKTTFINPSYNQIFYLSLYLIKIKNPQQM
jgi:hypothetical protein